MTLVVESYSNRTVAVQRVRILSLRWEDREHHHNNHYELDELDRSRRTWPTVPEPVHVPPSRHGHHDGGEHP